MGALSPIGSNISRPSLPGITFSCGNSTSDDYSRILTRLDLQLL